MTKVTRKAKGNALSTTMDVWLWRMRENNQVVPKPKEEPKVFGEEVGVGEDWSHLNKRRQRAREKKVARDVAWLREMEALRAETSETH
jgi:hypothetical protein